MILKKEEYFREKIYISQISDYITESIEEDFYLKTIHLCHTKET